MSAAIGPITTNRYNHFQNITRAARAVPCDIGMAITIFCGVRTNTDRRNPMKLSGKITKLGAMAAIVMSLAAAAAPASAADYHGHATMGRPAVTTIAYRHDDRTGPRRVDQRKDFAWRDMHKRDARHEHCSHKHFEHADFRR
jgi:hypothetical protein